MASILEGVCPQCFLPHRRVTAPAPHRIVKNCENCAILAKSRLDLSVGKFPQFFTLNAVLSISEAYAVQLQRLIEADKESQAKTQELLRDLRETIKTVESINFED